MGRRLESAISGSMFDLIGEIRRQHVSDERIRKVNESGLFAKMLKANVAEIDREAFERVLGLAGPPTELCIITGGVVNYSAIKDQIRRSRMHVADWAEDMICGLARTHVTPKFDDEESGSRKIVFKSNEDLGFSGSFDLRRVFAAGKDQGLTLCKPEDPLRVRLLYRLQPYGWQIRVAMDPIPGREEAPSIFRLECTDEEGLSIDGICGDLDRKWDERRNLYWMFRS